MKHGEGGVVSARKGRAQPAGGTRTPARRSPAKGDLPMRNLHDVIATDIPDRAEPVERAPLELDEDITRQDAWIFAPLIAAGVVLPLVVTMLLAFGAWRM